MTGQYSDYIKLNGVRQPDAHSGSARSPVEAGIE